MRQNKIVNNTFHSISIFDCLINSNRIIIPRFRIRISYNTIRSITTKINFLSFIVNNIINYTWIHTFAKFLRIFFFIGSEATSVLLYFKLKLIVWTIVILLDSEGLNELLVNSNLQLLVGHTSWTFSPSISKFEIVGTYLHLLAQG